MGPRLLPALQVLSLAILVLGGVGCGASRPSSATEVSGSSTGSTSGSSTGSSINRPETAAVDPTDRGAEPSSDRVAPRGNGPIDASLLPAPPDVAAIPPSAAVTPSGLASRVLRPGSGTVHPTATSRVRVHYTGWTTDGHMFDSSRTRGEVAEFPLNAVIAGWTEGVQLMVVGEERRLWIPASLAYGDSPRAGAPTGMLVFDVELIAIP